MLNRAQAMDDLKQQAAQTAAMKKIGQAAFFDPAIAFVTGPVDAKTTLVEFYDYDCPYCRASLPAVKKFYDAHKSNTRFSFIEFPIKQLHGESAILAAKASLAARRQPAHYMDFHFALLGREDSVTQDDIYAEAAKAGMDVNKLKADMADPEIEKTLKSSIDLAHKAGVDGTPTFILNGKFRPGAVDDETLASEMKS
jgi:protein-disulfide isomerase